MPIYEYKCKKCNHPFDKLVRSMSAGDEPAKCPKCGSNQSQRALSVVAPISSESGGKSSGNNDPMCGRCGGPGPCAMD